MNKIFKDFVERWMASQWVNYRVTYTYPEAAEKLLCAARLYFYEENSTIPATVYMDAEVTTAHCHPIIADGSGHFPDIYFNLDTVAAYTCKLDNRDDETLLSTNTMGTETVTL